MENKLTREVNRVYNKDVEVAEVFCFQSKCRYPGKPLASTTGKQGGGTLFKSRPKMTEISGIYKITNRVNRHHYIGSSQNIYKRWGDHKRDLDNSSHHSRYLQRAWNKYGGNNFEFEVLLICEVEYLIDYEQLYLDTYPCEYNIAMVAGSCLGVRATPETIKKLRESHLGQEPWNRGKKASKEARRKMSKAHEGRKPEDYYWYGKKRRRSTVEKIASKKRGVPLSEEHKEKISKSLTGIIRSEDTRRRISEAKRIKFTNKQIEEMRKLRKGGLSYKSIAKAFEVSRPTIQRRLQS
jgi:group I intron endonuclease